MDVLIPILAGILLAVFINYVSDVLPVSRKFSQPVCETCGAKFPIGDQLTIHRCRECNTPRGARPWLVAAGTISLNLYIWHHHPAALGYWLSAILITYMTVVIVIDAEHRLILHPTSVVGCIIGFLTGWQLYGFTNMLTGGIIGFGLMFAFYYLGILVSKYRTKKMEASGLGADDEEALGAGDVILAGILGMTLGYNLVIPGLFLGIILAGLFGFIVILYRMAIRQYQQDVLMLFMPYGPFLVLGAFIQIFILSKVA
jgi:leader peptidase (prepilin peptidase)/N-methyltransferase